MDALVYGKLDGIETALNTLVDSITSYNPSVAAATELLVADDELDSAVKQRMKSFLLLKRLCALTSTQW